MAWHIFERLLEEVANQSSNFIGKIWITSLFMFRFITVISIGDTIYDDEQSAFTCNTQQPGCENVCFNRFSPISQIRFYAMQILFVGTPSVIYIIYAIHKRSKIPTSTSRKIENDVIDNISRGSDFSGRNVEIPEIDVNPDVAVRLPDYEDLTFQEGKISSVSYPKNKLENFYVSSYDKVDDRIQINSIKKENSDTILNERKKSKPNPSKPAIKRKIVYKHDSNDEIITTPSITRAYFIHVVIRCTIEAIFLYMQYSLYKLEVLELFVCEGYPCPRVVECFISRPMEKTVFLQLMYAMTALSLILNVCEVLYLIWRRIKSCFNEPGKLYNPPPSSVVTSPPFRSSIARIVEWKESDKRTRPKLGPYPRTHSNSFGSSSNDGSIHSDYPFYIN